MVDAKRACAVIVVTSVGDITISEVEGLDVM